MKHWLWEAVAARSAIAERWKEADRRFARDDTVIQWGSGRSRIYVPLIYMKVQTLKNNIVEALWGNTDDFFDISPIEPLDTIPARALKKVDGVWLKKAGAVKQLKDAIHQHLLLGSGVITIHWDSERGMPIIKWRDILSVYPSPNANSVESAQYIIVRNVVPKHILLKQREKGVYNFKDESLEGGMPLMQDTGQISPEDERRSYIGEPAGPNVKWDAFAEVLEVFEDEETTLILNRKEVIDRDVHRFGAKPIIITQCIRKQTGIWGEGLAWLLTPEENRQITIDNMQMDNLALQTYRMFLVRKGAIAKEDIEIRPEGIIQVMAGRGSLADRPLSDLIQPLAVQDMGATANIMRAVSTRIADDVSGVFPMIQGTTTAGVDTATEFSGLLGQASLHIKSYLFTVETDMIEPMIEWVHRLARENSFSARKSMMRILGDRFMGQDVTEEFASEVLQASSDWDVILKTGSRYVNEQLMRRNMLLLAQVVLQNPYVNTPYFLEKLFEVYGFSDASVLVAEPVPGEAELKGAVPPTKFMGDNTGEQLKAEAVNEAALAGAIPQ